MCKHVVALLLIVMATAYAQTPQILQVYRDFLKPGSEASYAEMEAAVARICVEMKCPHPYLALESLTGPKEVWFLNGYSSQTEMDRVVRDYVGNSRLMAALKKAVENKKTLVQEPVEVLAAYRQHLGRSRPWHPGRGRFLVITVTRSKERLEGTTFEAADGTQFIVVPAHTRQEADEVAVAAGPDANAFAVRACWSMPAKEWIDADPEFWQHVPASIAKP